MGTDSGVNNTNTLLNCVESIYKHCIVFFVVIV